MKNFTLTIKWDRLRQGEFPTEEFKKASNANTEIIIEKITNFQQKVTIKTVIDDNENELELAYEIGSYIHSILVKNNS